MATIEPPWRLGEADDTPLRAADDVDPREQHAEAMLDHFCELITAAYIAENMGDLRAFVRNNQAALAYLDACSVDELQDMVSAIVCNHASRAAAAAITVPDHVPAELTGGGDV